MAKKTTKKIKDLKKERILQQLKLTKKTTKKIKDEGFNVTLTIFGRKYTSKAKTLPEALALLKVPNVKGKSILLVEGKDLKKERILQPMQTYRLLNTMGMTKEVAIKHTTNLFI